MNIFDSYIEAGQELNKAEKAEYYVALIEYLAYQREPQFKRSAPKAIFIAIKPSIDKSRELSESGKKGAEKRYQKSKEPTSKTIDTHVAPHVAPYVATPLANSNSKSNSKEDISSDISKKKGADLSAITEIVNYLNQAANTSFKAASKNTQSLINARTREGFTLDDFKTVIDGRVKAWANDPKMSEYLRPQTLFGTKFESYLNASKAKPKTDEEEWDELFEEYARYERENTTVYCPPC